ncbi:peptidylprolyl isomerase [Nocardiopsis composta]|uniref:Peptidyl-prolyl cis-trans isomerase n=1 Tax=Nocardiopsis composta TaxID=157465 RepID=A0A7W8QNT0_9ACTN|nr:peptidylprolyl isomerase [Nocardiopsis composta]MBB5433726.1 peptidyl-prolyl cis-trans isomerase A (cyclophilin A) [Nocardiopsis composta]
MHRHLTAAALVCAAALLATGCGSSATGDGGSASDVRGATLHTSEGEIELVLFPDRAPETVRNFAELAEDDPGFYDGTVFHRVIPDFMIQGGDPEGTGTGGPGYTFDDEIDESLTFAEPGMLAMANSGPDTNGSQFFVTTAPAPHLNGRHTVFGEVADEKSLEVADAISRVPTGDADRPAEDVVLESVEIHRGEG